MNVFTYSSRQVTAAVVAVSVLASLVAMVPAKAGAQVAAPLCTVEIVSNTDAVVGSGTAVAVPTPVHLAWTANIPGATWIWGDDQTAVSPDAETYTFLNQFGFVGTVISATLFVASDNAHSFSVNSESDSGLSSFNNVQTYPLDVNSILQGDNELEVTVTNDGPQGDLASNPAGALYRLVIEGSVTTDGDCSIDYGDEIPVLGCTDEEAANYNPDATSGNMDAEDCEYPTLYRVDGYVWHDDNGNSVWDGQDDEIEGNEEGVLARWTVYITNGEDTFTTTTDEDGYYYFDVPAGTWVITEEVQDDWERTTQESFEVVIVDEEPVEETLSLLDSVKSFFIPTAFAQSREPERIDGVRNFGNNEIERRGGGSSSGTRVGDRDRDNNDDDTPNGEVLGASDDAAPTPAVLGDQVTAVPAGAADTGAGGTAPNALQFFSLAPVAFLSRNRKHG